MAAGEVDGTPVAVSGGPDGTVRVWDLRAGAARGEPLRGTKPRGLAVAAGEVDGIPVAVTGGGLIAGAGLGPADRRGPRGIAARPHRRVEAVAAGHVDGDPGGGHRHRDGTVRVWDLRTGAPLGKPLRGHTGVVDAVATGEVDGVPVAVSGDSDGTVRVWDLRTGAARGRVQGGQTAGSMRWRPAGGRRPGSGQRRF